MFKISRRLDYAIIILRDLAQHYGQKPRSLKKIAAENHLPYNYLAQIVIDLKDAGLIIGHEGVKGGYELSRPADGISLAEIAKAVEPEKNLNRCLNQDHRRCKLAPRCQMSPWWFQFNIRFQQLIKKVTLQQFL